MSIWDTFTGRKASPSPSTSSPTSSYADASPGAITAPGVDDVSSFFSGPTASYDPSQLHPLAGLNQDSLEFLTLEDSALSDLPGANSALPSRGWSDDLCYGTGVTYLTALTVGGAWGLAEGLNKSPPTASPRLKLNYILNAVTRRGPFLGNSAGVVALVYNGINSTIGHYRGKHDAANSVVAGALSGIVFKSTRGVKQMMISGGLVATAAGAWTVARRAFF
ncbi:mitochondrial import inner membrane translocase subunit tim23 [Eremomyces bilateralis CBS 781.70]|uniref:Mitochondrial import inner membrane translocase subunit TIM23 n=1 Tax=Eremomyces bilateralis CBS 781.70 TaxID=1392243 RepID=A0A6G1G3Z8_9PEZI|nr:mitochondrial import inner membrane translocase subunit tim23 [Eremomyces bilateralis CBS 781.70]KAF1812661.1 mitochondrial import inner membrane translocase subunit tim23 [Eremomyces bilateralis CBS 781.70]